MSVARRRQWMAGAMVAIGFLKAGCGTRAWSKDESARIDQILKAEKFSEDLPGAAGTAVYSAPAPVASLPQKDYAIDNSHAKPKPPVNHRGPPTSRSRERTRSSPAAASTTARSKR
jgi:hypothetical protein